MVLEVEQKYPAQDLAELERRLAALGGTTYPPSLQYDQYFAHPGRDFALTDEALRVRRVGEANCLTYKGPKQGDSGKTRPELELPIAAGADGAALAHDLLQALGFRPVAEVCKLRRLVALPWNGWQVAAALDEVAGLGAFIELEVCVDQPDQAAAAGLVLADLAAELGLHGEERRSYLELLLSR